MPLLPEDISRLHSFYGETPDYASALIPAIQRMKQQLESESQVTPSEQEAYNYIRQQLGLGGGADVPAVPGAQGSQAPGAPTSGLAPQGSLGIPGGLTGAPDMSTPPSALMGSPVPRESAAYYSQPGAQQPPAKEPSRVKRGEFSKFMEQAPLLLKGREQDIALRGQDVKLRGQDIATRSKERQDQLKFWQAQQGLDTTNYKAAKTMLDDINAEARTYQNQLTAISQQRSNIIAQMGAMASSVPAVKDQLDRLTNQENTVLRELKTLEGQHTAAHDLVSQYESGQRKAATYSKTGAPEVANLTAGTTQALTAPTTPPAPPSREAATPASKLQESDTTKVPAKKKPLSLQKKMAAPAASTTPEVRVAPASTPEEAKTRLSQRETAALRGDHQAIRDIYTQVTKHPGADALFINFFKVFREDPKFAAEVKRALAE